MRIALFITCLTDQFYPRAGEAVVRVLEHLGHDVIFPSAQTCCGQPMYNNGYHYHARAIVLRMAAVFESTPHDAIVTPSASCAAMLRVHALDLFPTSATHNADRLRIQALADKTFEFAEFLTDVLRVDLASLAPRLMRPTVGLLHESCHGRSINLAGKHAAVLSNIDGLEIRSSANAQQCCGFGGTFSVKYPGVSTLMVADKVAALQESNASTYICSDAGCTMNIAGACRRAGADVRVASLAELLAESLGLMTPLAAACEAGVNTTLSSLRDDRPPSRLPIASQATSPAILADSDAPHNSPLFPTLPYDLRPAADRAAGDIQLQQFVNAATRHKDTSRVRACDDTFGDRYNDLRRAAGEIKQHTLDHLDRYLESYIKSAESAGCQVHFAFTADQANAICIDIARRNGATRCVKSKSMVTEETHLLPALQHAGIEAIETDLGEYILQLDGDAPSHLVTPMIHKNRASVARAFVRELGVPYTEDPRELAMIARKHLRSRYRAADIGISGANFLAADTGTVVLCTNEGNADFCVAGPKVHVAFVGIEKLIPRLADLPIFLKLLARSATAQPMTVYTTFITGPRRPGEHDGPDEVHIILLDNGRARLLEDESSELLRCIRCGACLNACPVYRKVGGGHAYGSVYSGPIGAVLTPMLKELENYPDLPHASSLCGACFDACPVHINIPRHLVRLREKMVDHRLTTWTERALMNAWGWSMRSGVASSAASIAARAAGSMLRTGDSLDVPPHPDSPPHNTGWISSAPGPLAPWTSTRDLPAPAMQPFRAWWHRQRGHHD